MSEIMRLLMAANRKIKMMPYSTAVPKLFVSMIVLPFPMP
jgi:hypothetical protein